LRFGKLWCAGIWHNSTSLMSFDSQLWVPMTRYPRKEIGQWHDGFEGTHFGVLFALCFAFAVKLCL
jgi:hypothetical protein